MIVNGIEWSENDIMMVEKFESIRQRGMYCDGQQITEYYNRLLNKKVNVTSCGSCLRQRVQELSTALTRAREKAAKEAEAAKALEEQNKPQTKVTKKKK